MLIRIRYFSILCLLAGGAGFARRKYQSNGF
ncbi:MprA protease, GlyGly-CTERM protein-sorting domain-containing form [Candidatus Saccharibacteria bacterium]|nr:MprA protease, GlyGly-CTERM protein-sorting domain-containing form [Candidatus Saccharibacteria bacterium]